MELIFVRHARPVRELNTGRVADPGLSELGVWQTDRLTNWLGHERFDAVIASPKARAIETVAPIAASLDQTVRIYDDLDEIDRGSFVYYPTETLVEEGEEYWTQIAAQNWDAIGWDPPEVFRTRCVAVYEQLVSDPPGERVLVGSHGGTIGAIVAHLLGMESRMDFGLEYASITRVEITEHSTRLRSLNETGHFDAVRDSWTGPMRDGTTSGLR